MVAHESAQRVRASFNYDRMRRQAASAAQQSGQHPAHHYLRLAAGLDALAPPSSRADIEGAVYFVGGESGPVKIGFAVDPVLRLTALQCGSPVPLSILATIEAPARMERAYHKQFAAHRLHGEWFARAPEIVAEIKRVTALKV